MSDPNVMLLYWHEWVEVEMLAKASSISPCVRVKAARLQSD